MLMVIHSEKEYDKLIKDLRKHSKTMMHELSFIPDVKFKKVEAFPIAVDVIIQITGDENGNSQEDNK
ncbi:MAG: hypothetical protein KAR20_02710 [Candidatus Heimdallarchaeota archaeon]|nr:hypothetical protein [Candidatus Heimdallarchaeota archaeon]